MIVNLRFIDYGSHTIIIFLIKHNNIKKIGLKI